MRTSILVTDSSCSAIYTILLCPCPTLASNSTTYRPLLPSKGTPLTFQSCRYVCYVKDKSSVFVWLHYIASLGFEACHLPPYDPVTAWVAHRTGNLAWSTSRRSRSGLVGNSLTAVRSYKCAASCNCSARRSKWSHRRACSRIEWRRGREASAPFAERLHPCHHHFHLVCAAIATVLSGATASYSCPSAVGQRT